MAAVFSLKFVASVFLLAFLGLFTKRTFSQELALPPRPIVKQISKYVDNKEINEKNEGAITYNPNNGLIYIGFSHGIIEFDGDGEKQRLINNDNEGGILAMVTDSVTNTIFVGAKRGFGVIRRSPKGLTVYQSLYKPDSVNTSTDFNKIIILGKKAYIFSLNEIFVYSLANEEIKLMYKLKLNNKNNEFTAIFNSIFTLGDRLFLSVEGGDLFIEKNQTLEKAIDKNPFSEDGVLFTAPYRDNKFIIFTKNNRVFVSDGSIYNQLVLKVGGGGNPKGLYFSGVSSINTDGLKLILSTEHHGCYIVDDLPDNPTQIVAFPYLQTNNGLPEDNIHAMFIDPYNRLWLAHSKNFSWTYVSFPISAYKSKDFGRINAVSSFNNRVFVATESGLYILSNEDEKDKTIAQQTQIIIEQSRDIRVKEQELKQESQVRNRILRFIPEIKSIIGRTNQLIKNYQKEQSDLIKLKEEYHRTKKNRTDPDGLKEIDQKLNNVRKNLNDCSQALQNVFRPKAAILEDDPESINSAQLNELMSIVWKTAASIEIDARERKIILQKLEEIEPENNIIRSIQNRTESKSNPRNTKVSQESRVSTIRPTNVTDFRPVKGALQIGTSCYTVLNYENNYLIIGTSKGIFYIDKSNNFTTIKIPNLPEDDYKYLVASNLFKNRIFFGSGEVISSIILKQGKWIYDHQKGFDEKLNEITSIAEDETGTLWVGTGTEGVYGFKFEDRSISTPKRLEPRVPDPADKSKRVLVFGLGKQVLFLSNRKSYTYSENTGEFIQQDTINKYLNFEEPYILYANDLYWILNKRVIHKLKGSLEKNIYRADSSKVFKYLGNVFMFSVDPVFNILWVGSNNEVIRLNINDISKIKAPGAPKPTIFLRTVRVNGKSNRNTDFGDSLLFINQISKNEWESPPLEPGKSYNFRIEVASTAFENVEALAFFYHTGDDNWTRIDGKGIINLNDKSWGNYAIYIKSVDTFDRTSDVLIYRYTILRPIGLRWYMWAFLYLPLVFGIGYILIRYQINKAEEAARKEAEEKSKAEYAALQSKNKALEELLMRTEQSKFTEISKSIAIVAHEINSPLGAIKAATQNIQSILPNALSQTEALSALSPTERQLFIETLSNIVADPLDLSFKEKRDYKKKITADLEAQGVNRAELVAERMINAGLIRDYDRILPLFAHHPQADNLAGLMVNLSMLVRQSTTILSAVGVAQPIVNTLKEDFGRQDVAKEIVKLDESVRRALRILQHEFTEGVDIIEQFDSSLSVYASPRELLQVWMNLAKNAFQAMEDNKALNLNPPKLIITIQRLPSNPNIIRVSFEDNGPGISPEIRQDLFKVQRTTKAPDKGTGLGLPNCKVLISNNNGTIDCVSEPGKTIFFVDFST